LPDLWGAVRQRGEPSRKNPHFYATCIEFAPPDGMEMEVGVMFADVRGFTRLAATTDSNALSALLRRFYAEAEKVLSRRRWSTS